MNFSSNLILNIPNSIIDQLAIEECILVTGGSIGTLSTNNGSGKCDGTNNADGRCSGTNNATGLCQNEIL